MIKKDVCMDWEKNYQNSSLYFVEIVNRCLQGVSLEGKRVLDAGCWWGWFMRYVRDQGGQAFGFDYDLNKLKDAVTFVGNKGLASADAQYFPFKDKSLDVVFSWHVLEHIPEPNLMLKEIHRVLKDDGHLVLAVPNDLSLGVLPYRFLRLFLNDQEKINGSKRLHKRFKSMSYSDDSHFREYTRKTLLQSLERNAFDVDNIFSYGCELPYPIRDRLNRSQIIAIHRSLGNVMFPSFRSAWISCARKKDL
jgi:ubiquinone/menaquinone biosynthesis C-methylase UbiE